jgi:hypothetical protein
MMARADLLTITTSGVINEGFDANGFFGPATNTSNNALIGDSYTLSITFDTSVNVITATASRTEGDNPVGGTVPGGGVVVATVNGVSRTIPFLALVDDQFFVDDSLHNGVPSSADEVYGHVSARDDNGVLNSHNNLLDANNDFFSLTHSFLSSADFNQPFSLSLANPPYQSSGVHFDFTDNSGASGVVTVFDGSATTATLSFTPSQANTSVPEPQSVLVLFGSLAPIFWRRRQR